MVEEVELKLELPAQAVEVLAKADFWPGEAVRRHQISTYWDTPDHALERAGFSLRLRRSGKDLVQTVKRQGRDVGVFIRSEWEFPAAHERPVLDERTPLAALLGKRAERIGPVFTIDNERRIWNANGIEIALDQARIRAGAREQAFAEVELECKGGAVRDLFDWARKIDAQVPVHLGVLSKPARGYALRAALPLASHAGPLRLPAAMGVLDAFEAIGLSCLHHFRANAAIVLERQDGAALHQARVALRRLRSAIAIFAPVLETAEAAAAAHFKPELAWLAGELAPARDIDVLIERLSDADLRAALGAARLTAHRRAGEAIESARARAILLDLAQWLTREAGHEPGRTQNPDPPSVGEFALAALERGRRKVKRKGRDLATLDDVARHDLRKAAKTLRYAADFFQGLFPDHRAQRRHRRFVKALEALQEKLGVLNDMAAVPRVLADLDLPYARFRDELDDPARRKTLLEDAAKAHRALMSAPRFWR